MDTFLRRYDDTPETQTLRHSREGMTKYRKRKRSVTPAKAGGPLLPRSSGLNAASISIRCAHMDTFLRRYDEMPETQTLRRSCEGSGVAPAEVRTPPLRRQGAHLSHEVRNSPCHHRAFAALTWIPSYEGMTKCTKHKRLVAPAEAGAHLSNGVQKYATSL